MNLKKRLNAGFGNLKSYQVYSLLKANLFVGTAACRRVTARSRVNCPTGRHTS